jgi:hypothetical protein
MVKIIDFKVRTNSKGEQFCALVLQGGLELVKSKETGNYYATAKSASITSTFTEDQCKGLIGQELSGSIVKLECEPYEYTIKDTGEVITLKHRWEYRKEGDTIEEVVHQGEPEAVAAF